MERRCLQTFRNGSVAEIIEKDVTGRIVSSVEEAMLALPEVIALDRRAVRWRFEERFTASRMAKDYVNVYHKLLKRGTPFDARPLAPSMSDSASNFSLPIRLLPTPPTCRVLPGSGVKLCVGRCGDVARDAEQGTEGVERIEPPVEAEGEFVEVGLQVLVTDPVMDAVQPRFQVCEDEMDDWQILLGDLRIAPFSDGEVFVAALGKAGVAAPVVGDERRARHNSTKPQSDSALRSGTMASRTRPA